MSLDENERLDIRPEVGMYAAFARLNYQPWYALAEYIDNALQSHIERKDELTLVHGSWPDLEITVQIDADKIVISDNAGGIAGSDVPRAFSPAKPPPNNQGLSEFGLGMKAASSWFARAWEVRTCAIGESVERTIRMDVDKIVQEGIESVQPSFKPAPADSHYTTLTLMPLRRAWTGARTLGKIRSHLESIYRRFTASTDDKYPTLRLSIQYPSQDWHHLSYKTPEIVKMPLLPHKMHWKHGILASAPHVEWKKPIHIQLGNGKEVQGWVGLLIQMRKSTAGWSIFRRGRLIVGGHDEGWRPRETHGDPGSYPHGSIVGELDAIGFDVSHTKDGIDWGEDEEFIVQELEKAVKDPALNLFRQTQLWLRKPKNTNRSTSGESTPAESFKNLANEFQNKGPKAISDALTEGQKNPPPPQPETKPKADQETNPSQESDDAAVHHTRTAVFPVAFENETWMISLTEKSMGPTDFNRWYTYRPDSDEAADQKIDVVLNADHEFTQVWMNETGQTYDTLLRVVAFLALAEHMAVEKSPSLHPGPHTVRHYLNELLTQFSSETGNST